MLDQLSFNTVLIIQVSVMCLSFMLGFIAGQQR